jgi:hypothetical protein
MKYTITLILLLSFFPIVKSQIGVNTVNPQSTLDIVAKTTDGSKAEGLLAPRLSGDQIKAGDAQYGSAQDGLLVYATSAVTFASPKTVNITSAGYYYFDGTIWQKFKGADYSGNRWELTGNSGTVAGTNFLGTIDNVDMVTKTNNIEAMRITNGQKLLLGNSTVPTGGANSKVIIDNGTTNGSIQIKDGTQCSGCLLRSDAEGVGTWKFYASSQATIVGVMESSTAVIGNRTGVPQYANLYIDLPPGKWLVNMGLTVFSYGPNMLLQGTLSSSKTTKATVGFAKLGPAGNNSTFASVIRGDLTGSDFNFFSGSMIVNVTNTPNQRIYLLLEDPGLSSGSGATYYMAPTNFENYLYAIPLN